MISMTNTVLTAYLPIPMPSRLDDELFWDMLYGILNELSKLSGTVEFPLDDYGSAQPTIALRGYPKDRTELKPWFRAADLKDRVILKVEAEVPMPQGAFRSVRPDGSVTEFDPVQSAEIRKVFIRGEFGKRLNDLVVVANLSRVGSLEVKAGVIVQDGALAGKTEPLIAHLFREAYNLASSIGWPKIQTLAFASVWSWAVQQKGFLDGFGEGPVGRALNAMTHLFEYPDTDELIGLFWALVGVEALYVIGKSALIEQVRDKSQVVLGPQESFKKVISRMYEFRSRFIHGDLDFPGTRMTYDFSPALDKFGKDLLESNALAVAILVATLQEIAQRGWKGLQFTYTASDVLD